MVGKGGGILKYLQQLKVSSGATPKMLMAKQTWFICLGRWKNQAEQSEKLKIFHNIQKKKKLHSLIVLKELKVQSFVALEDVIPRNYVPQ